MLTGVPRVSLVTRPTPTYLDRSLPLCLSVRPLCCPLRTLDCVGPPWDPPLTQDSVSTFRTQSMWTGPIDYPRGLLADTSIREPLTDTPTRPESCLDTGPVLTYATTSLGKWNYQKLTSEFGKSHN